MFSKKSKYDRILSLYSMLNAGEIIDKAKVAAQFNVTERTIQRDISDIRAFYCNNTLGIGNDNVIEFDRKKDGYKLVNLEKTLLTNSEILAVSKILLESRSLVKSEMLPIINKLIDRCVCEQNKKSLVQLINNEMFHYVEPRHGKQILDMVWDIGTAMRENRFITIEYIRSYDGKKATRKLKPVGIMVSEFYLYLTAFIDDIDKKEHFDNPDDLFPTIYRIDRMQNIKVLDEKFSIPYANRFEEGEFRKRIQFMYGGKLQKVRLIYSGRDVNSVLDRLPTAEIISKNEEGYLIKAEVFGKGIDMWFKSQEEYVELLLWEDILNEQWQKTRV